MTRDTVRIKIQGLSGWERYQVIGENQNSNLFLIYTLEIF